MAQQIKKKFIKSDAIDGSKIKLLHGQTLRMENSQGQEFNLLSVDVNGKLLSSGNEIAFVQDVNSQIESVRSSLQDNIDSEESARIAGDQTLQSNIDSEESARISGDQTLQSNIDAEMSRAMSAESDLDARLDVLEADPVTKTYVDGEVSDLQTQINNVLSNIDPTALDSLTEIVSAFQEADGSLQGAINTLAQNSTNNIQAEESARIAADQSLQNQISQEVSDRQSADSVLQGNIDTEESERVAADLVLQGNIDTEESERIAADLVLQGNIDSEESRAMGVEASLQSQITQEVSDRQSAVSSEQSARIAADETLQSNIDSEMSRAMGVEGSLQSQITQEVSDRQAADLVLQGNIDSEMLRAINVESDLQDQINTEVSNREAAISAEESARIAADQSLQSNIDTEMSRAMGVESSLQSQITQEISDREVADSLLDGRMTSVENELPSFVKLDGSRVMTGNLNFGSGSPVLEQGLPWSPINVNVYSSQGETLGYISTETGAVSNDPALFGISGTQESFTFTLTSPRSISFNFNDLSGSQSANTDYVMYFAGTHTINVADLYFPTGSGVGYKIVGLEDGTSSKEAVNKGQLDSVESSLTNLVNQEVSDRQMAVSAEESARIAADEALDSRLDVLEADPVTKTYVDSEVSDLQTQINNVLSNIDPEALDSLTEIVSAFQGADGSLQGAINTLAQNSSNAISAEESARIAADLVLQGNIDTEESERIAADLVLQGNIDTEMSRAMAAEDFLQSQITQEGSYRVAADQTLQSNINSEESSRIAADQTLQSNIDTEMSRAMAVESSLQSQISQEISDRQAAVSAEESARIAGDLSLEGAILGEQSLRIAADNTLQSNIDAEMSRAMGVESGLDSRLTTAEGDIDALELRVTETEADITTLQSQVLNSNNDITNLVGRVDIAEDDIDALELSVSNEISRAISAENALDARLDILEAKGYSKEKFTMSTTLTHVDLSREVVANSLVVAVGRLMAHKDEDFTVSVVNGVTRLTFIGDFASGGVEAIESGDVVFVTYAY